MILLQPFDRKSISMPGAELIKNWDGDAFNHDLEFFILAFALLEKNVFFKKQLSWTLWFNIRIDL